MDKEGEKILKEDFDQLDTDEDGLLDLSQFLELFRLMKGG
jgi:Ca2+-binding EF-hand superfamily protein